MNNAAKISNLVFLVCSGDIENAKQFPELLRIEYTDNSVRAVFPVKHMPGFSHNDQVAVLQLARFKPVQRAIWFFYVVIVCTCTAAGAAWTQNRIGGAIINFMLSLSLVALDDIRVKRRGMEQCRVEAIATARREFGLALSDTASIEQVGRMLIEQLPYRTQRMGYA